MGRWVTPQASPTSRRHGVLATTSSPRGKRLHWPNPPADVAQLVEHHSRKVGVEGSSPSVGFTMCIRCSLTVLLLVAALGADTTRAGRAGRCVRQGRRELRLRLLPRHLAVPIPDRAEGDRFASARGDGMPASRPLRGERPVHPRRDHASELSRRAGAHSRRAGHTSGGERHHRPLPRAERPQPARLAEPGGVGRLRAVRRERRHERPHRGLLPDRHGHPGPLHRAPQQPHPQLRAPAGRRTATRGSTSRTRTTRRSSATRSSTTPTWASSSTRTRSAP